jgi:hypothetical protein
MTQLHETPGARVLDGRFMSIRQAIGMSKGRPAGSLISTAFVEDIKASGWSRAR